MRDARDHGVEVREPDVNDSAWDRTLETVAPPVTGMADRCPFQCPPAPQWRHGDAKTVLRQTEIRATEQEATVLAMPGPKQVHTGTSVSYKNGPG